ncbi:MAG: M24 family metallopeptidase, partial [Pseudomonadota bacterium]
LIKSDDELICMRWSIAVAELGIAKMEEAIRPGVSESQLWALLNYTNLANDGDWHDGRMLATGPRTNPWYQEATKRRIDDGDLVAFDTDMVGPFGYCADISRTMHCGPGRPTRRQKELYQLAVAEVEYNMGLIRPGLSLTEFQERAFSVPEEFQDQAYTCVIHGVGLCDEYPRVNPRFRGKTPYNDVLCPGMVICVESYMGAVGERDGVKLEQQVLVTETGCEQLSTYPLDDRLLN